MRRVVREFRRIRRGTPKPVIGFRTGLRGLLGLLHDDRRAAACALDLLLDGAGLAAPSAVPGGYARTPAVLVVDDSASARRLHARALRCPLDSAGVSGQVSLVACDDGLAAIEAVGDELESRRRCFVLCLVDLTMPRLDGCGLARRLRAAGSTAPLVAVTASALPRAAADVDDDDAVATVFDDVVQKPFRAADARLLVHRWVLPRLLRKRLRSLPPSPAQLPRTLDLPPDAPSPSSRPSTAKRRCAPGAAPPE